MAVSPMSPMRRTRERSLPGDRQRRRRAGAEYGEQRGPAADACHPQPGWKVSVCRQLLRRQRRRGGDGITDWRRRQTGERVQHFPFTPGSGAVQGRQEGAMRTPPPSAAMANTCTRRISAGTSCAPTAIARATRSRCRRMLRAMSPSHPAPAHGTWRSRQKGNTPTSSLKWRVKSRCLPSATID